MVQSEHTIQFRKLFVSKGKLRETSVFPKIPKINWCEFFTKYTKDKYNKVQRVETIYKVINANKKKLDNQYECYELLFWKTDVDALCPRFYFTNCKAFVRLSMRDTELLHSFKSLTLLQTAHFAPTVRDCQGNSGWPAHFRLKVLSGIIISCLCHVGFTRFFFKLIE